MPNPSASQFELLFVVSPIFLVGGIATGVPGNQMPIISLTDSLNFSDLTTPGDSGFNLDDAFAHYHPLPGGSIQNYEFGEYPFANQVTAANAIITRPLNISLMMVCPERQPGDYSTKPAVMQALKQALSQHALAGGTYTVATPSCLYENCLLKDVRDASSSESHKGQWRWQWDFEQPLVTLQDAANVTQTYNARMGAMANGQVLTPNASGAITSTGTAQVGTGIGGAGVTSVPANQPSSTQSFNQLRSGTGPTQIPLGS
jgi:hypothetical protein